MKDEIKVRYEGLYTVANTVDGKCLDVENLFSCITNDIRNVILEAEYRQEVRYMVWQVEDDAKDLAYKVDNFIRELSWMSKELRDAAEYYKYMEDRISRELEKIGGFGHKDIFQTNEGVVRIGAHTAGTTSFFSPYLWSITDRVNAELASDSVIISILKDNDIQHFRYEQPFENRVKYSKYMMNIEKAVLIASQALNSKTAKKEIIPPEKPIFEPIDAKLGYGLGGKVKVVVGSAELEFKRVMEGLLTNSPKDTLYYGMNIRLFKDKAFLGIVGQASKDLETGQPIPNSQKYFIGLKVGANSLGFGQLPTEQDLKAEIGVEGYFVVGGQLSETVNLSEAYRFIEKNGDLIHENPYRMK